MDLDWVRKEVKKSPDKIDWLKIMDAAKEIYKEDNEKKSVLGLSKGFLNFIKSSYYDANSIMADINTIYNQNDIVYIKGAYHNDALKALKEGKITKETIIEKIVILITDRTTVEKLLHQYSIPYIKFSTSVNSKRVGKPIPGVKAEFITTRRWKKEGQKGISWVKGQALALKRENVLDDLFNDED